MLLCVRDRSAVRPAAARSLDVDNFAWRLVAAAAATAPPPTCPLACPAGPCRCFRCKQVAEKLAGFPSDYGQQVSFYIVDLGECEVGAAADCAGAAADLVLHTFQPKCSSCDPQYPPPSPY